MMMTMAPASCSNTFFFFFFYHRCANQYRTPITEHRTANDRFCSAPLRSASILFLVSLS